MSSFPGGEVTAAGYTNAPGRSRSSRRRGALASSRAVPQEPRSSAGFGDASLFGQLTLVREGTGNADKGLTGDLVAGAARIIRVLELATHALALGLAAARILRGARLGDDPAGRAARRG